ncbi:MAG: type III-B CRISPR-associated protein Cas10/Cmr2 [Planctomycetaceae bacterium]
MTSLLALELGPVVQIIAAARKTRDVWFGSWMLSEIGKAVARSVIRDCGGAVSALIAPAPQSLKQLDAADFLVGDELLVLVPDGVSPADVAADARMAAHEQWLKFAADARQRAGSLVRDDQWNLQIQPHIPLESAGETVDVSAAWVELTADYRACLSQVRRLLFGRTQSRNFATAPETEGTRRDHLPKSSLDGRRETVLRDHSQRTRFRRLRLLGNEQLDALGVTKRMGQGKAGYPSTARIAADPWIRGVAGSFPDNFLSACEQMASSDTGDGPLLGRIPVDMDDFPTYPQYRDFPYEGAVLYQSRHKDFLKEAGDGSDIGPWTTFESSLNSLYKQYREPGTYYAILVADGDRVGQRILQSQSADEHRELSRRLSDFAGSVRGIVQQHQGALVFAAGDDLTAFLPLDQAVACADALRRQFSATLGAVEQSQPVTLSVGVAIGHFMESMEDLLASARSMEARAKSQPGKNALAVRYQTRSGSAIDFCYSWNLNPAALFDGWVQLVRSSSGVAYDLKLLVDLYRPRQRGFSEQPRLADWAARPAAMRADTIRMLSLKDGSLTAAAAEPLIPAMNEVQDLENLANMIIVAGHVRAAVELAGRPVGVTGESNNRETAL